MSTIAGGHYVGLMNCCLGVTLKRQRNRAVRLAVGRSRRTVTEKRELTKVKVMLAKKYVPKIFTHTFTKKNGKACGAVPVLSVVFIF